MKKTRKTTNAKRATSAAGKRSALKRKPKVLPVVTLGHPSLRRKARRLSIKEIGSAKMQEFIDNLIHTCETMKGVGIAATQAGVGISIFIMASKPSERYPKAPHMKPAAFINPKLIAVSGVTKKDWEGCLSLRGLRALVPRHTRVKVSYADREGRKHIGEFEDFLARVFQHEHDHLNGLMFIDRVTSTKDFMAEDAWLTMMNAKLAKRNMKTRKKAAKKK